MRSAGLDDLASLLMLIWMATFLIVDDKANAITALREFFELDGHEVAAFTDPRECRGHAEPVSRWPTAHRLIPDSRTPAGRRARMCRANDLRVGIARRRFCARCTSPVSTARWADDASSDRYVQPPGTPLAR